MRDEEQKNDDPATEDDGAEHVEGEVPRHVFLEGAGPRGSAVRARHVLHTAALSVTRSVRERPGCGSAAVVASGREGHALGARVAPVLSVLQSHLGGVDGFLGRVGNVDVELVVVVLSLSIAQHCRRDERAQDVAD